MLWEELMKIIQDDAITLLKQDGRADMQAVCKKHDIQIDPLILHSKDINGNIRDWIKLKLGYVMSHELT